MAKMNGNAKWVGIIIVLVMALSGWIWQAAITYSQIEANTAEDAKIHPIVEQNEKDLIAIKRDVQYIREGVDEIKMELRK